MKILQSFRTYFVALTLGLVTCVSFNGCGTSGGGGGGGAPDTTRPKTLDGLTITLPGGVTLTFTRNVGTPAALLSGQVETGTFTYNLTGTNLKQYPNINGDESDVSFPDSVSDRTYTYLAVNENSGVLTMNGVSVDDLTQTGVFDAANGSFTYFFHSDSATASVIAAPTHQTVRMDITFNNNGGINTSIGSVVLSIVGSAFPELDTTLPVDVTITQVGGGPVPVNYNPVIDPNRPSAIVPVTLNNLLILFTNGVPDPTDDFTVQFTRDATFPSPGADETGTGLQRVAGAVTNIGIQYTWGRTDGTDNGNLVLSQGGNTFDGVYELQFISESAGIYVGTVDGGTPDAAEVSGTFVVRSN